MKVALCWVVGLLVVSAWAAEDPLAGKAWPGRLECGKTVEIRSEVGQPAALAWVIGEGTRVEEGDLLAELDDSLLVSQLSSSEPEIAAAEAQLQHAEAGLEMAREEATTAIASQQRALQLAALDRDRSQAEFERELKLATQQVQLAGQRLEITKLRAEHAQKLAEAGNLAEGEAALARFELMEAESNLMAARSMIDHLEDYVGPHLTSTLAGGVDQAEEELNLAGLRHRHAADAAEAELRARRAAFRLKRDRYERLLEQRQGCKIHAPRAGLVTLTGLTQVGNAIRRGQLMLTLHDLSTVQTVALVDAEQLGNLRMGQPATVRVDAFPGRRLKGEITAISQAPERFARRRGGIVRNHRVTVGLAAPSPDLLPGMSATVQFQADRGE